ncbi:MAG: LemA family protein [Firmicutes bacterium]|nr:LemA family protein [Bacillota bacterium]
MGLYIGLGVIVLLGLWFMALYNGLVSLRERVQNAWSQIDVQLRRRYDLIPNLVSTVKGYAAHERETLEKVTTARTQAMAAGSVREQAEAENMLSGTLKTLYALAENYPQLKADANFRELQEELSATENKIAFSRQFYNDTVQKYNTRLKVFPVVLFAGALGFKPAEYFTLEGETGVRNPVDVKFE